MGVKCLSKGVRCLLVASFNKGRPLVRLVKIEILNVLSHFWSQLSKKYIWKESFNWTNHSKLQRHSLRWSSFTNFSFFHAKIKAGQSLVFFTIYLFNPLNNNCPDYKTEQIGHHHWSLSRYADDVHFSSCAITVICDIERLSKLFALWRRRWLHKSAAKLFYVKKNTKSRFLPLYSKSSCKISFPNESSQRWIQELSDNIKLKMSEHIAPHAITATAKDH